MALIANLWDLITLAICTSIYSYVNNLSVQ